MPSSYARAAPTSARGDRATPCASPPRTASCGIRPMASIATTWPTDTCGSKNCASRAAITMSASATQWNPPPAQMPFTAVITGFRTCWCQRGEVEVPVLDRLAVALDAHAVARELGEVDAGLERAALAGVHDHPHRRVGVELEPGVGELVAHLRAHRVEVVGPVVDQPPDRAAPLDEQGVVAGHDQSLVRKCASLKSSMRLRPLRAWSSGGADPGTLCSVRVPVPPGGSPMAETEYRHVTYETLDDGTIARIMLNRPEMRNAQNRGDARRAQRRVPRAPRPTTRCGS